MKEKIILLLFNNSYLKWESLVDVYEGKWGICFVFIIMNGDKCFGLKNFVVLSGNWGWLIVLCFLEILGIIIY